MNILEYLYISFSLFAASQALLFMWVMVFADNPRRVKAPAVLLMIGICTYLVMPLVYDYTPFFEQVRFVWLFSSIAPSMLLLFVWFTFEEQCNLPKWLISIVLISLAGSVYYQFFEKGGLPDAPLWLHLLKIAVAISSIFVVWMGRANDLVELRAKLRTLFVSSFTCIFTLILLIEVATDFDPPVHLKLLISLVLLILSMLVNYFFLRVNPSGRLMNPNPPTPVKRTTTDPVLADLLVKMKEERLYADHDLRISSLADRVKVPEYKLRKKINQELGYRNFNHFVNHYRIEEAGLRLADEARTPVLSIALDVGFRSISSFNTAFQTQFGLSPTKYRAEILSDS